VTNVTPVAGPAAIASLAALVVLGNASPAPAAGIQPSAVTAGKAGFVVTLFEYAMSRDASQTGACPTGLTQGMRNIGDVMPGHPELQRRPDETDTGYSQRTSSAVFASTENLCMHPERSSPDTNFHTVSGPNVPVVGGIDLDGQDSRVSGIPAPGTCAHDDFRGMNGERGIDNQFFRVAGCIGTFQPGGQTNDLVTEMMTGTWGIVLTVSGIDDMRNDPSVEVGLYANADPIELSATRTPIANATYTASGDPRFRAIAHGRIVNGVLTSDPVDVRFYSVFNTVRTERPLRDARVRLTFTADGGLEGYLAGYTPVEAMYDVQFGFRNGTEISGAPASTRLINTRSIGQANFIGHYSCQGAYYALLQNADGHRDPATGRCTSISTQYHIRAIPAFVVDAPVQGK
jgi:hypothetical protein